MGHAGSGIDAEGLHERPARDQDSPAQADSRDGVAEGTAIDSVLDDVGDAPVELVDEQLEPAEDARFDDGLCRERLVLLTALAPSPAAYPPLPIRPPIRRSCCCSVA